MKKLLGRCENCGRAVFKGETLFEIRIDIYAKGGPIELEPEDLEKDHLKEMKDLIARMEKMDVDELTDEVWESYRFNLCHQCRKDFHSKLKMKVSGTIPPVRSRHSNN